MADILIRGMEEPPHCSACRMLEGDTNDGFCHAANKWFDDEWFCWYQYPEGDIATDKPLNCPLVPLPEGHGRLIDADALIAKYTDEINKLEGFAKGNKIAGRLDAYRACHIRAAYLSEARINIEAAPAIIEAEGLTE